MANRTFIDAQGVHWEAWDVIPTQHADDSGAVRSHLPGRMSDGWLCFESRRGKRRLAPIPQGWEALADAELDALCRAAAPVKPRHPQRG